MNYNRIAYWFAVGGLTGLLIALILVLIDFYGG